MSLQSSEALNGFAPPAPAPRHDVPKVYVAVHQEKAAPKRGAYVPGANRAAAQPKGDALSRELVACTADDAFRSVAWDGVAVARGAAAPAVNATSPAANAEPTKGTLAKGLVDVSTRSAFTQIAWSGAKPAAPTQMQDLRSVKRLMGTFHWE